MSRAKLDAIALTCFLCCFSGDSCREGNMEPVVGMVFLDVLGHLAHRPDSIRKQTRVES